MSAGAAGVEVLAGCVLVESVEVLAEGAAVESVEVPAAGCVVSVFAGAVALAG